MNRLVLYAPNVHTGGGLVLLKALLSCASLPGLVAILDARASLRAALPEGTRLFEVAATPWDRLRAELMLRRLVRENDTILCFHGLPPLLRSRARILVFVQNREYVSSGPLDGYRWKTRCRLHWERFVARTFRSNVSLYVVQTASMRRIVQAWHGGNPAIRVLPFADDWRAEAPSATARAATWDFVYVSDGEAHKNHARLIEAWCLLAQDGIRPSLVLTLGPRDEALLSRLRTEQDRYGLRLHNLGLLERSEVLALYPRARALIFPSTLESFGLPLIEAQRCGLPILAPELDYVRDVCVPVETFDPASPISIARAVKRFLGLEEPPTRPASPADFLRDLLA